MLGGVDALTPTGRPRKRRRTNDARQRAQAMQHRLQVLMVGHWGRHRQRTSQMVRPDERVMAWLESDWFVRVCQFVGPVGAYALCRLARASKAATEAIWQADVTHMRRYGLGHSPTGLPFLPWYSIDGHKRPFVPKHYEAHPVPNVFRIPAMSRLCRVCFGAQSRMTQIKLKVGQHFASGGKEVVPVCEPCVRAGTALVWSSVQVFCHRADHLVLAQLLQVINMPTPVSTKGPRRTTCGWPTVLLGPLCRASNLSDAGFAALDEAMARTLLGARVSHQDPEATRRALLDCAVKWGGLSVGLRRCLR